MADSKLQTVLNIPYVLDVVCPRVATKLKGTCKSMFRPLDWELSHRAVTASYVKYCFRNERLVRNTVRKGNCQHEVDLSSLFSVVNNHT